MGIIRNLTIRPTLRPMKMFDKNRFISHSFVNHRSCFMFLLHATSEEMAFLEADAICRGL